MEVGRNSVVSFFMTMVQLSCQRMDYLLSCWWSGWRSAPQHRRVSAPPRHCPLSLTFLPLPLLDPSCRSLPILVPLVVVKLCLQLHVGGGLLLQPRHQLVDLRLVLCFSLAVVRDCVIKLCLLVGNLLVQHLEYTLRSRVFGFIFNLASPTPTRATCPSPWPGARLAGRSPSWESDHHQCICCQGQNSLTKSPLRPSKIKSKLCFQFAKCLYYAFFLCLFLFCTLAAEGNDWLPKTPLYSSDTAQEWLQLLASLRSWQFWDFRERGASIIIRCRDIISQVPQPTCFWKWHSWQLGNLTRISSALNFSSSSQYLISDMSKLSPIIQYQ